MKAIKKLQVKILEVRSMINLNLDFAKLAIQYLESRNEDLIKIICDLPASDHLYFHAYN